MDIDLPHHAEPLPQDPFPPEMLRVMRRVRPSRERGFVTMGVPVGDKEFVQQFFKDKLESIEDLYDKISDLRRKQTQLWLLRTCASYCKVMYWMRIMDPAVIGPFLRDFDKLQFALLQDIVGVKFDSTDMLQAKLRLSQGGLVGIRSAE